MEKTRTIVQINITKAELVSIVIKNGTGRSYQISNKLVHGKEEEKGENYKNSDEDSEVELLNWSPEIEVLADTKALNRWIVYLAEKKQAEINISKNSKGKFRTDALWKKILRDARKFYRTLLNCYLREEIISQSKLAKFYEYLGLSPLKENYSRELYLYFLTDQN